MRRLPVMLCGLLVLSTAPVSQAPSSLVGTWQLVSRVDRGPDGAVLSEMSLGSAPLGYLMYDAAGHVSAQLSSRERPAIVCDTTTTSLEPNNNANIAGYSAYFGRYEVDAAAGVVTHFLEGTLAPADVGKRLVRRFRVHADTLTIQFEPGGAAPVRRTRTVVWHRVSR